MVDLQMVALWWLLCPLVGFKLDGWAGFGLGFLGPVGVWLAYRRNRRDHSRHGDVR